MPCKIQVRNLDDLKQRAVRIAGRHGISVSALCGVALQRANLEKLAAELSASLRRIDWRAEILETLSHATLTRDELCQQIFERVQWAGYPSIAAHRITRALSSLVQSRDVEVLRVNWGRGVRKYRKKAKAGS